MQIINIIFWNTNKKNLVNCLQEMLIENNVDLLILAEYPYSINELCHNTNTQSCLQYKPLPQNIGCKRIYGLINNKYNAELLQEQSPYRFVKISKPYYSYELIVAMVHAPSKLWAEASTQKTGIANILNDLIVQEHQNCCEYTMAIGDFNASPFEETCIGASAMHAIPFPDAVKKEGRRVQRKIYKQFYNPTWKFFGNRTAPYTTYYCDRSGQETNFYWYALDQVVVRPSLIKAFDRESLRIITKTKSHRLLNEDNIPNKINYSDHLPLFCRLNEEMM